VCHHFFVHHAVNGDADNMEASAGPKTFVLVCTDGLSCSNGHFETFQSHEKMEEHCKAEPNSCNSCYELQDRKHTTCY
jgi:hypothetical protein